MKHAPTATVLAKCSELVYARPGEGYTAWKSRLSDDLEALNIKPLVIGDRSDVQFFVGLHYGHRITCFRGSDSKSETISNLMALQVRDHVSLGSKVHGKFLADLDIAMVRILAVLDYTDGKYIDWFTGHSRGAAIAAIAAARVTFLKKTTETGLLPVHLVSHGLPRVGNGKFASYLRDHVPHVRWQRSGDIVPLLPLPPFYRHDCPPDLFDSQGYLRRDAGLLTRLIEWPEAILEHLRKPGLACMCLHEMRELRKLIENEESSRRNILLELLT